MQSFNDILFWHKIYSKWISKSKFISLNLLTMLEKYLPSTVKTEIPDYTSPGRNRFKTHRLIILPYSVNTSIVISSGVEMKTIGNHTARFKNTYLRKLTKSKIPGAFTCLLTVCKSVSHGRFPFA